MYISTFYSFKGGVGRTQALVNVAAELANRGRRVLLVDFDLEAPGLSTFLLPSGPTERGGIVEYVTDYVRTREAPDVKSYVSPFSAVGPNGGGTWVMPSGSHDASYAHRLASLDWTRLYEEYDGFYLFEDLKLQWEKAFAPDYVFIDSRTGHTDVGGICTRQLPDAVAIFFLPNNQNLNGLAKIVDDIRGELASPRRKRINIDFVLSNIPDIDDEDGILQEWLENFQATLNYDDLSCVIHRYDDLDLLNQVIFTLKRDKTGLAREYRSLADKIAMGNVEDRAGAVGFLASYSRKLGEMTADQRLAAEDRLDTIARLYATDGEVLQRLANLRMYAGRFADSLSLWDQVVAAGTITPEVLLGRAEARFVLGENGSAIHDLLAMFDLETTSYIHVSRAVGLLREVEPTSIESLAERRAIAKLDAKEKISIANQLQVSREGQRAAIGILESVTQSTTDFQKVASATNELAVCLIGVGRFEAAIERLERLPNWRGSIRSAFNYAMAQWGRIGEPNVGLFNAVCAMDSTEADLAGANYSQCLAIAYGVTGRTDLALSRLDEARSRAKRQPHAIYSCWRYLTVSRRDFDSDTDEIARFIAGEVVLPRFIPKQRILDLSTLN